MPQSEENLNGGKPFSQTRCPNRGLRRGTACVSHFFLPGGYRRDDGGVASLGVVREEAMGEIVLYAKKSCTQCKKAIAFLNKKGVPYQLKDIVHEPPPRSLLEKVIKA